MNNIETRAPFFPRTRSQQTDVSRSSDVALKRNSYERAQELKNTTSSDARVNIPEQIKDFSRIKKVADAADEMDNSDKIAKLKQQIQAGTYSIDYDALADKMLASEY